MHPILAIGLVITLFGVFADQLKGTPATKVIKIEHKKKEPESAPVKKESAPNASDSED